MRPVPKHICKVSLNNDNIKIKIKKQSPPEPKEAALQSASTKIIGQLVEQNLFFRFHRKIKNVYINPASARRLLLISLCVCVRFRLTCLLLCTGPCSSSNIPFHLLLNLSLSQSLSLFLSPSLPPSPSPSLSHPPESKGLYQGAPARPDITGRGSVVVVEVWGDTS